MRASGRLARASPLCSWNRTCSVARISIAVPHVSQSPCEMRIGQVLSNLVGNARKYAPDGSPIVVGATIDGPWLAVTIDDEGVGVPEAEWVLVTEPFHRAWNVRESRIPGTGLGLFIRRRLVEAHGGRLEVLDRPDGRAGTRARFTLPLAAAGGTDGD